jgi:hypothetical protein
MFNRTVLNRASWAHREQREIPAKHSGALRRAVASFVTFLLATGILIAVPSVAFAGSTVINFDNMSNGTIVSNQYTAQGITFDQSPSGSFGYKPTILSTTAAHSQPNVLDIEQGGFCGTANNRAALWAHFSAPRNNVSMYAGDWQNPASEQVTLVGYDMNGAAIPGATDTVTTTPNAVSMPMSITDPGGRISFVRVQGPANTECLSVDDVGFSAPAPDTVLVTNPGPQEGYAGYSTGVQIMAVSNYDYPLTYQATGLPPGLFISSSTGLISGKPTSKGIFSATVTVTDTHGARASVTFTWTITKLWICKPPPNCT